MTALIFLVFDISSRGFSVNISRSAIYPSLINPNSFCKLNLLPPSLFKTNAYCFWLKPMKVGAGEAQKAADELHRKMLIYIRRFEKARDE